MGNLDSIIIKKVTVFVGLQSEGENSILHDILPQLATNTKDFDYIPIEGYKERMQFIANLKALTSDCSNIITRVVELPETGLYTALQRETLIRLLELNNVLLENNLIITTHSPYILNYLTLAVKAYLLYQIINIKSPQAHVLLKQLTDIVPINAMINPKDLAIYEVNQSDGSIKLLGNYRGLPLDNNLLNRELEKNNEFFSALLDIEDEFDSIC